MNQSRPFQRLSSACLAALLAFAAPAQALAAEFGSRSGGVPQVRLSVPGGNALPQTGSIMPSVPDLSVQIPAVPGMVPAAQPNPIQQIAEGVQPRIEAINRPSTSDDGSASAGRQIADIIQGARSIEASGDVRASSPDQPSGGSATPGSQLSKPEAPKAAVPAAPAPPGGTAKPPKRVDSRLGYAVHRLGLLAVAAISGTVASLPLAGPKMEARLVEAAASKKYQFYDFDDTLGPHNAVLAPDMVEAVVAAKKAGKQVIVITDRPDVVHKGSSTKTVFESLSSIPAAERAGIYVSANSGGRVYRYDDKGEPEKIFDAPAMAEDKVAKVRAAAEATKARLAAMGASQHPGDQNGPAESYNPYGFALMLAVGTPEAKVIEVSKALQEELEKEGIQVEVLARLAKDPTKPPYVMFSELNKAVPVKWIAERLGIKAKDAVGIGDSMYTPRLGKSGLGARLKALAERLSGRPMPLTGNETDRNMEKGLPGMLMLSVGLTADPHMRNGYVLPGKGPSQTKRILERSAANPSPDQPMSRLEAGLFFMAILAAGSLGWYMFYRMLAGMVMAANGSYSGPWDPFSGF